MVGLVWIDFRTTLVLGRSVFYRLRLNKDWMLFRRRLLIDTMGEFSVKSLPLIKRSNLERAVFLKKRSKRKWRKNR